MLYCCIISRASVLYVCCQNHAGRCQQPTLLLSYKLPAQWFVFFSLYLSVLSLSVYLFLCLYFFSIFPSLSYLSVFLSPPLSLCFCMSVCLFLFFSLFLHFLSFHLIVKSSVCFSMYHHSVCTATDKLDHDIWA